MNAKNNVEDIDMAKLYDDFKVRIRKLATENKKNVAALTDAKKKVADLEKKLDKYNLEVEAIVAPAEKFLGNLANHAAAEAIAAEVVSKSKSKTKKRTDLSLYNKLDALNRALTDGKLAKLSQSKFKGKDSVVEGYYAALNATPTIQSRKYFNFAGFDDDCFSTPKSPKDGLTCNLVKMRSKITTACKNYNKKEVNTKKLTIQ